MAPYNLLYFGGAPLMAPQILTLRAIPLTPIHIGDGTELTPDSYVIRGNELLRFDPVRVLAAMEISKRKLYLQTLNLGNLEAAQKLLCDAVGQEHIVGRVAVSDASKRELQPSAQRTGRVHPFVRSGGKPFIPGSSIKGAFRTALLDYFTKRDDAVKRRVNDVPSVSAKHQALVKSAFALARDDSADDLLRFLSVADVSIPDNATRVDPAIPGWRAASGGSAAPKKKSQIQLHIERLSSAAETGTASPSLTVNIAVDCGRQVRINDEADSWGLRIGRPIDWETIRAAANAFFWGRWQYEKRQFFPDGASRDRLDALLKKIPPAAGMRAVVEAGPAEGTRYLILRVGRFSHFESLSVDNLREGDIPQKRIHRAAGEEGKNRTVTEISFKSPHSEYGKAVLPFGWLLLYRAASS